MNLDRLPVYPYGIKTSLTYLQIAAHLDAIERFNIGLFVELGVLEGGLASVIRPCVERGVCNYVGVELKQEYVNKDIAEECNIIYGDCFSFRVQDKVRWYIDNCNRPALVFCDNGNKPRELIEYAPILRPGDYLSVHDYGTEVMDGDLKVLKNLFVEIEPEQRREFIKMPLFKRL